MFMYSAIFTSSLFSCLYNLHWFILITGSEKRTWPLCGPCVWTSALWCQEDAGGVAFRAWLGFGNDPPGPGSGILWWRGVLVVVVAHESDWHVPHCFVFLHALLCVLYTSLCWLYQWSYSVDLCYWKLQYENWKISCAFLTLVLDWYPLLSSGWFSVYKSATASQWPITCR